MQQSFKVPFADTLLHGDCLISAESNKEGSPNTLFLHGAGKAERTRFMSLRALLFEQYGIASCAFDFIGHGETGGTLLSSSLKQRTEQASAVIDAYCDTQKLNIIAASMSAYTALKLSQLYPVYSLTLMVPAAYSAKAYGVQFGDAFSKILRRHRSWEESDSWKILQAFSGAIYLVSCELDEVIPVEIVDRLYDSAKNANRCLHTEIAGCNHQVLNFLNQHPEELDTIANKIVSVIAH